MSKDDNEGMKPALKNLSDAEIRLNCLDLAVRSWRLTGAGRPGATPMALARTYLDWVKSGKEPAPPKAVAQPAPLAAGIGHGTPPGHDEMAGEAADDLTPGNQKPSGPAGSASLRQAGAGKE